MSYRSSSSDLGLMDEYEYPLFSMRKIDYEMYDHRFVISHVQIANSVMYIFMHGDNNDRKLCRTNIGDLSSAEYFDLKVDPIMKTFVSPPGSLVIFCTEFSSYQTYFFSKQMKKYKNAQKVLKDCPVQCIAFNRLTYSEMSCHFLMGSKSEIISVEYSNADLISAKNVYSFAQSSRISQLMFEPQLVMGLEILNVGASEELCVFCATKDRIYIFTGTKTSGLLDLGIQNVFKLYSDNVKKSTPLWFPDGNPNSQLQAYFPMESLSKPILTPKQIFWLAGPGIVVFDVETPPSDQFLKKHTVIEYPKEISTMPKSFAVTNHHVILLYDAVNEKTPRIKVICSLNKKTVFEDNCRDVSHSSSLNIVKDFRKGDQYLISDKCIYSYYPLREDRNIWKIYLEMEEFDWALKYAGTGHPNRLNEIFLKKAEYFFRKGKFDESADLYAKTTASFEEIALQFIDVDKMSLKNYLCSKLDILKSSEEAQITMLVMWIIQLYLSEIHLADDQGNRLVLGTVDACRDEFHNFLRDPKRQRCLSKNKEVVYDLLGSHGDRQSLTLVAEILNDYDSVLQNLVENEEYNEALERLSQYKKPKLFYKYSSVLMQHNPMKTVDVWKRMSTLLKPKNLIPAIVQLDSNPKVAKHAIKYLEFCLSDLKNTDTAIHNCLITLYAMHDPSKLMPYLELQNASSTYVYYDREYALRICLKHEIKVATIFLYKTMKLYEEAVDQALKFDNKEEALTAAQEIASYAQEQDEEAQTIKKLWLRIARYVVQDKKDVRSAMDFLRDNEHIKIEDILPFFPDFFTINEFKEAILTSLNEYNDSIERLKGDMQNATEIADKIRASIKENRRQYTVIKSDEKCSICGYQLLLRAFYSFPCRHAFHYDCLLQRMKTEMSDSPLLTEIERLESQIKFQIDLQRKKPPDAKQKDVSFNEVDAKREELDNIIASECVYCGEIMIQSIHKPFIAPEHLEAELASWL